MVIADEKTLYVDHTILLMLAGVGKNDALSREDAAAMRAIWSRFEDGETELVSSLEDTKMDLIHWLNGLGCCVTDTLSISQAIGEFEGWGRIGREQTQGCREAFEYYEQLDSLPSARSGSAFSQGGNEDKEAVVRIRNLLFGPESETEDLKKITERRAFFLRECLCTVGEWYTEEAWKDLRRTDYEANWRVFESIQRRGAPGSHTGGAEEGDEGSLFGLLNRAIGLSKKSCGKLPMTESHQDFIIRMVLEKYTHNREMRSALHIYHCLKSGITHYLTADYTLIEKFRRGADEIIGDPALSSPPLQLSSPSEYLAKKKPR